MTEALTIKRKTVGDVQVLTLSGNITEDSHIEGISKEVKPHTVIDLGGVNRINSYGIRQWINAIKELTKEAKEVVFFKAPAGLIEQFNMISNFGAGGIVYSYYLPYYCESCDKESHVLSALDEGKSPQDPPELGEQKCPDCKKPMAFNDIEEEYFYFLSHQKGRSVSSTALQVLKQEK